MALARQALNDLDAHMEHLNQTAVTKPTSAKPITTIDPSIVSSDALEAIQEQIQDLNDKLVVPVRLKEGQAEWLKQLEEWNNRVQICMKTPLASLRAKRVAYITATERIRGLQTELQKLQADMLECQADIQALQAIPYNTDCWACQANHKPSQERLGVKQSLKTDLSVHIKSIQGELKTIQKSIETTSLDELDSAIQNIEWVDAHHNTISDQKAEWAEAEQQWKANAKISKQVAANQIASSMIHWQLWDTWTNEFSEHRSKRDTLKATVDDLSSFCLTAEHMIPAYKAAHDELALCLVYEEWLAKYTPLEFRLNELNCCLWNTWIATRSQLESERLTVSEKLATVNEGIQWQARLKEIERDTSVTNAWTTWLAQSQRLHIQLKQSQLLDQWRQNQVELEENTAALNWILKEDARQNEVQKWQRIVWSFEQAEIGLQLNSSQATFTMLSSEINHLQSVVGDHTRRSDGVIALKTTRRDLLGYLDRLTSFRDLFVGSKATVDGFKNNLYRTRILPLIEADVNAFLSNIDSLVFEIRMIDTKLVYMVHDRGNTVLYDHSSGYQKFIIGLALRATLCRIGAGCRLRHLLIDEGFVSMDSVNQLGARTIVYELMRMGNYSSVIIMSHLDAIREIAQKRVDITRDDSKFSSIRWGALRKPMKKSKTVTKATLMVTGVTGPNGKIIPVTRKPRGRPPKKVVEEK